MSEDQIYTEAEDTVKTLLKKTIVDATDDIGTVALETKKVIDSKRFIEFDQWFTRPSVDQQVPDDFEEPMPSIATEFPFLFSVCTGDVYDETYIEGMTKLLADIKQNSEKLTVEYLNGAEIQQLVNVRYYGD
jgi:hypothetical protein